MIHTLGKIIDRQILYLIPEQNSSWAPFLPESNWLLFAIADNPQISKVYELAKICRAKNVLYLCSASEAANEIEDIFDFEFVNRKVQTGDENYDDTPITTKHEDFDEAFWFASVVAKHEIQRIDKVICINLTDHDYKERIMHLIGKINKGWLPS